jgi:hypothetical protein
MAMNFVKLLILGFIAGALATLIFHQSAWYLLVQGGIVPPDKPAWPMDAIPPWGIPSTVSKMFWGGLWGAVLALFLARVEGAAYWFAWIIVGALGPSLVAIYIVPLVKGLPIGALWPRIAIGAAVNGAWGLGTAVFLRLFGAARR